MARPKTLFMETTTVPANRTIQELTGLILLTPGVSEVTQLIESGGVNGISFTIIVSDRRAQYKLPARIDPVYRTLAAKKYLSSRQKEQLREKAVRVAWRQLYRWVQAQLALIQLGMVAPHEVFLPYMLVAGPSGPQTVFEQFAQKQLSVVASSEEPA